MYVNPNYKTKKAFKEAVKQGAWVRAFAPGLGGTTDGVAFIEGPHYPQPHTWYAKVELKDGNVVKVVS